MDRIDLHTHSTASDGSMTPSELVHYAASCGLRAVALTDHDTTVGLTEAQQAANEIGIELVHGVELATWLDKTEFHIVGLDINENNPHFQTAMARMQQIREERNNQMVARMQAAGVDITLEKLELVISEIRGDPIAKVDDIFLEVKPDELESAIDAALYDFDHDVLGAMLRPLSRADMTFLEAMSQDDRVSRVADLQERLGVSQGHVQSYRRRLIDAGVIYSPARGELAFIVPRLGAFIKREML